jgi:biopolymer transport protein ExbD
VVFELPPAPFQEGLYESITAVLIPVSRNAQQSETLVFFDDERYSLADIQQVQRLGAAMRTLLSHTARRELLLLADRQVPHGDVMAAVNLARSAGVQRVNVGVKPD